MVDMNQARPKRRRAFVSVKSQAEVGIKFLTNFGGFQNFSV